MSCSNSPEPIRVRIVGDHPHAGITGILTQKTITLAEIKMFEVDFDDDFGRGDTGCFAEAKHLRILEDRTIYPANGERTEV